MAAAINSQRETMVAKSLDELAGRDGKRSSLSKSDLVASNRVQGTQVYRPDGEKIGRVEYLVIEKTTGRVRVVVMSFGGFLGLGKDHRPVSWDSLNYDEARDGYVLTADEDTLRHSPIVAEGDDRIWDPEYQDSVFAH